MIVGVDLGLTGAIAILDDAGKLVFLSDMPTVKVPIGKRLRGGYDRDTIEDIAADWDTTSAALLVIEDVYHIGYRGSLAARAAGIGWGLFLGLATAYGWREESVAPSEWQRALLAGRSRGKGASRVKAAELFPGADLGGKADQGRADALLLATYGWRLGRPTG